MEAKREVALPSRLHNDQVGNAAPDDRASISGHSGAPPASHRRTAAARVRSIARRSAIRFRTSARWAAASTGVDEREVASILGALRRRDLVVLDESDATRVTAAYPFCAWDTGQRLR
ncbi:hypothetical protein GCM10009416_34220 [Craurococcus roseus]|uniref:Winged helix-turn-helix domain-containing protein n=1 Tax=Craurococcus roseus TaxID=77585 RepID=A0ABN1FKX5_9PROT